MNMETKMLIKQLSATTKEKMIEELKSSENENEEMVSFIKSAIKIIEETNSRELLSIKTELLSVY